VGIRDVTRVYVAPLGLGVLLNRLPRALPWAGLRRAVGACLLLFFLKCLNDHDLKKDGLSQNPQTELHKLARLSKRATVFLSYARPDREIAARIRQALEAYDYSVWFDEAVTPGQD
jgi:hypothetical protein